MLQRALSPAHSNSLSAEDSGHYNTDDAAALCSPD